MRRLKSEFDFDFHAGGEFKPHQGFNCLVGRTENVDEPLVDAGLELLAGILVFVDRAQDGDDLLLGGERNRAGHPGACAPCGLDDLLRGLIDQLVIIPLDANANFFL